MERGSKRKRGMSDVVREHEGSNEIAGRKQSAGEREGK